MSELISEKRPLLLASASPRRKDFLSQLAIPFISLTPDVDEMQRGSETATDYLNRVVTAKVNSMGQQLCSGRFSAVLGADTIIRLDERKKQKC